MRTRISRRQAIAGLGMMSARAFASLIPVAPGPSSPENSGSRRALTVAGSPAEIALTAVTPHTLRVSVVARDKTYQPRNNLVLIHGKWPKPLARLRATPGERALSWGEFRLRVATEPLSLSIFNAHEQPIQTLRLEPGTDRIGFALSNGPLLGLGEGGPQFDRRGSFCPVKHGQRVPDLALNGARLPIP